LTHCLASSNYFRLATLGGFSCELGNSFCMLKGTVCREKKIVTEAVPQLFVAHLGPNSRTGVSELKSENEVESDTTPVDGRLGSALSAVKAA
jgi:hypothetical protein